MSQTETTAKYAAEDAIQQLLSRSATDHEFRAKLLAEPRATIEEATGRALPASFNVRFVENKADATIVLPDVVAAAELSAEQLEAVSGGTEPISTTVLVIGGITLLVGAVATGVAIGTEWHKSTCDEH
jgi:hypothetical protein